MKRDPRKELGGGGGGGGTGGPFRQFFGPFFFFWGREGWRPKTGLKPGENRVFFKGPPLRVGF